MFGDIIPKTLRPLPAFSQNSNPSAEQKITFGLPIEPENISDSMDMSSCRKRARMFARKDLPDDWPSRVIPILQAYANERRIEIVKTLAANGPLTFTALLRLAGIPETSLLRHLSLLVEGGVVALDDKRQYCVAKPKDALRSTLLTMATGG